MEYVLRMVDLANSKLGTITTYGTGAYATKQAADTVATNYCVSNLCKEVVRFIVGSGEMIYRSSDECNWRHVHFYPYAVVAAFGNGLWLVGDIYGGMSYSNDAITWTTGESLLGMIRSIAYNGSRFVGAGAPSGGQDTGYIYYSPNGKNWTLALDVDIPFQKTISVGSLWVAVGKNAVFYSTTSVIWSRGTIPVANWQSVAYGNGLWVAVGLDGEIATSTNGIIWVASTSLTNNIWRDIAFGNGKFIIVGDRALAYSSDGVTWEYKTLGLLWSKVVYGNGLWVSISSTISAENQINSGPDFPIGNYFNLFYSQGLALATT